jgi:hypothetical protein
VCKDKTLKQGVKLGSHSRAMKSPYYESERVGVI